MIQNMLRTWFNRKQDSTEPKEQSPIDEHKQKFIYMVIKMLENNPSYFTSRWFNKNLMDSSVQSKDTKILIMIDTGQIIRPIEPPMTDEQKKRVRDLIRPILKKDSKDILDSLYKTMKTHES